MNSHGIPSGSVVAGVDGSHHSDHAVDWAARHAANESRPLVLLHAVNASAGPAAWMAQGGLDPTPYLKDADAAGNAVLRAARARASAIAPGIIIEESLVRSDARSALLEFAADAQVVVLGSRGRGPVISLLLGSVGAAVSAHATCPVVVVRPHHPGLVRHGVLVGADGTESSLPVLDFAFRQASELDLPLTVALSAPGNPDPALALAETLVGLGEKFPEVMVSRRILDSLPVTGLLELADKMDLVVVGHHRHDLLQSAIGGSVALGIVEHAATVVAVVPQA